MNRKVNEKQYTFFFLLIYLFFNVDQQSRISYAHDRMAMLKRKQIFY